MNFVFKQEVDIGHLLTALTLLGGFVWWLVTTLRGWRQKSLGDAKSGALRLLLKLLRDAGRPCELGALYKQFQDPELRQLRKAYCDRNWSFKTLMQFEAAIYQLHWEGKIDFVSPTTVRFRIRNDEQGTGSFVPSRADGDKIVEVLRQAILNKDIAAFQLEDLAQSSMRISPDDTAKALREALYSNDQPTQVRVGQILRRLVPDKPPAS